MDINALIEAMAKAAEKSLKEFVNRSAAQHLRAMKKSWAQFDRGDAA